MAKHGGQSPSVEIDERQSAINRTTQAANWCVRILREFLVVADAPAGIEVPPTTRTAIFENLKAYGFQQQLAEPLNEAVAYISSESIRKTLPQFDGEPDRPLIASIDAWSSSWHHLGFHVLSELAENAEHILKRNVVIDYQEAADSDIRYFRLTMVGRRVPEDWLDVLYFVKHQWRYRAINLDLIESGILRENLQARVGNKSASAETTSDAVLNHWHATREADKTEFSPWIGSPELVSIMQMNNIKAANKRGYSDRSITRIKQHWKAEPQKGSNNRRFRFRLSILDQQGIIYPSEWKKPPT